MKGDEILFINASQMQVYRASMFDGNAWEVSLYPPPALPFVVVRAVWWRGLGPYIPTMTTQCGCKEDKMQ